MKQEPYIITERIVIDREYNPEYGDDRMCKCGHPYYRHFDTYEDMYPCGCKYCYCFEFVEVTDEDFTSVHDDMPETDSFVVVKNAESGKTDRIYMKNENALAEYEKFPVTHWMYENER